MTSLAIRNLAGHKLRASMTALAILLGVAMVVGTLILGNSVNKAFDDIFSVANEGVDVVVRADVEVEASFELPEAGVALPEELAAEVAAVDGVEIANPGIGDAASITILNDEGERVGPPEGGPPHIAASVEQEDLISSSKYIAGDDPLAEGEVAIDSFTAEAEEWVLGEMIDITGAEGLSEYEVVGIFEFGGGVPLGGASLAVFTLQEAQRITNKVGEIDEVRVVGDGSLSATELRGRISEVVPSGAEVFTAEEASEDDSAEIKEGFSFITTILLVFAGISVFVGAFLIFNTFSITVAQRTREFGMLRTLGVSSRQVLGSVVVEALAIGLIASAIGIVGGIGFVKLILAIFSAIGFELPQSGTPLGFGVILTGLAVGMISTLGSAIVPAIRATRVTPLEALQEGVAGPAEPTRRRTVIAAGLVLVGVALLLFGLFGGQPTEAVLATMGLGLVLFFIGVAMLGGRLIPPLASLVGKPIERLRGVTGRLARENTLRNPARTATTSSALMIGVALVVFALMMGTGITKSVDDALDQSFVGDIAIFNGDGFSPISAEVSDAVAGVDGIEVVSPGGGAGGRIDGDETLISGIDTATITSVGRLDWIEGDDSTVAELGPDEAIVESEWAADHGFSVGDEITITTPSGDQLAVTVAGSVRDRLGLIVGSVALPLQTLREEFDVRQDSSVFANFAAGADPTATREAIDSLLTDRFPNAEARSQQELKQEQRDQISQLLFVIYALLTMSVILSLVGVVNTLVLTVLERKREIGMLRAIGMAASQVRKMIRYEAVITAMIGAIVGAVVGIGIGIAAIEALAEDGLVLAFPLVGILAVLALAAIAGVIAGIFPARRASKIEVMEALAYE